MIRKLLLLLMIVAIVSGMTIISQAETVKRNPVVITESHHDVSLPLRDMAKMTSVPKQANREIENRPPGVVPRATGKPGVNTAVDTSNLPEVGTTQLLNFDGQGADGVAPPDTEGSIGGSQFVQWVNLDYNVYDKTTGALILGPVAGNAFWSGFGGNCQTQNDGDPIILYDKAAGRWFAAQNVFVTPYTVCIAVSDTDDATGTYHRYSFPISPSNQFPDYPKWGIFPGAYFGSYRDFTNGATFAGGVACALDRNTILAGGSPATMQCFPAGTNYDVLLPSDQDGLTPPPDGTTNLYVTLGVDTTHIDSFAFHVDFATPANSTFTGPTHLTVPAYTTICQSPFTRSCIPQPTGGEKLDSLGGFMMYRNAYRNFGSYESNTVAHTVAPSSTSAAKSAVRWYEIHGGAAAPKVFQSGTRQDSANSFWLPTMAQDKDGDIVLGFSASSSTVDPSAFYVGRVPTDKHGTMEAPKHVVFGTGVQKNTVNRWGDYATISVDPVDDCTMWFTTEYIKTTGSFNWSTRITSFKFPGCS